MKEKSPLKKQRALWAELWGLPLHKGIGPILLQKSIAYKLQEKEGGGMTAAQKTELEHLIKRYKRNPACFDERCSALKPGMRLIRKWKGKQHSILVKANGFEYQGKLYSSLSQIANNITGTRWNGYVFFGLKNKAAQ